jgi:tetratricopeptide (TPR) repeat protein
MSTRHTLSRFERRLALMGLALVLALAGLIVVAGPALGATRHPYNLGCRALAAGDVAAATDLFKEAVKLDPTDTDALNNLAVCFVKTGAYDKAMPLLEKVLRLNANYRGADLNVGAAYLFQDDAAQAAAPTRRARDTPPTVVGKSVKASALYNLGLIAAEDGQYADAKTYFEQSAAVAAGTRTDLALATTLCAQGEYDVGISALEDVAASKPDETVATAVSTNLAAAYYQRGMSKLEEGDVEGAKADLTRSNRSLANDYARMGLAIVDAEQGDTSAAIAVLTDIKKSTDVPALAKAASVNLARVNTTHAAAGGTSSWLEWLVLLGGGVLFAVQFYVVVRAATPSRRRGDAFGTAKVAVGAVAGLATAVVFAWAYLSPPDTPLWVLVALVVDLLVVAFAWWSPAAARPQPRSA